MAVFLEELARARALLKQLRRNHVASLKSLFASDAEYARVRKAIDAIEAGDIPGALPPYKSDRDQ